MLLITIMSRTPSSGRQPVKRQNHYMYHTQVHYNSEKLGFMALIFPIRKAPGKAIGPLPKVAKKKNPGAFERHTRHMCDKPSSA